MLGLSFLSACHNLIHCESPLSALLRTDSTEIAVRFYGNAYHAKIGFVYVNNTANPVSRAGCGGPGWPDLQKKVDGRWVLAYPQFSLSCLTKPDFWIASGATYHDFLNVLAFERGHNEGPVLLVDSIDGDYRLRWNFREGRDATAKSARDVEATSNEFRMVLRREAARDTLAKPRGRSDHRYTCRHAGSIASAAREQSMTFAIKAEVLDPLANTFTFTAQKTMYGGKNIAEGDTVFVFASANEGGPGLIARGIVTSAKAIARTRGIARQTPRVSISVRRTALAKRPLGRSELKHFTDWNGNQPEAELNFKFYRQATNKIVGISDEVAAFLRGFF